MPIRRNKQKANVLYINNIPFIGGAQITLRNIIRLLDRQQFHPILVIPEQSMAFRDFFAQADVEIIPIPMNPINRRSPRVTYDIMQSVMHLVHLVKTYKIDIIHTNCQRGGVLGCFVKILTGVKLIWTLNDAGHILPVRVFTRIPDYVTYVSNVITNPRVKYPCKPLKNFRLIYNGIPDHSVNGKEKLQVKSEIARLLKIPEGDPVIGKVGRLIPWKGQHVFISACAKIIEEFPHARFLIIGGPTPGEESYTQDLYKQVKNLGLTDKVTFTGFVDDVWRYYNALDILVHSPIECESFGMTVVEAMSHALPVVASKLGGSREVIQDKVTGFLFPHGDYKSLAKFVIILLRKPELRKQMGLAGRARYVQMFTQDRETCEFENLYIQLLSNP